MLIRNPKNGRSLYGLWQTLKITRKVPEKVGQLAGGVAHDFKAAVDAAEKQFLEAWKHADVMLSLDDM